MSERVITNQDSEHNVRAWDMEISVIIMGVNTHAPSRSRPGWQVSAPGSVQATRTNTVRYSPGATSRLCFACPHGH